MLPPAVPAQEWHRFRQTREKRGRFGLVRSAVRPSLGPEPMHSTVIQLDRGCGRLGAYGHPPPYIVPRLRTACAALFRRSHDQCPTVPATRCLWSAEPMRCARRSRSSTTTITFSTNLPQPTRSTTRSCASYVLSKQNTLNSSPPSRRLSASA